MFGSSGLNKLSEYAAILLAANGDISVESFNISDHIECTVDHNLTAITPIDPATTNTAVAELGKAPTTAEAASSAVPMYPRSNYWEFPKPIIYNGRYYKS